MFLMLLAIPDLKEVFVKAHNGNIRLIKVSIENGENCDVEVTTLTCLLSNYLLSLLKRYVLVEFLTILLFPKLRFGYP